MAEEKKDQAKAEKKDQAKAEKKDQAKAEKVHPFLARRGLK